MEINRVQLRGHLSVIKFQTFSKFDGKLILTLEKYLYHIVGYTDVGDTYIIQNVHDKYDTIEYFHLKCRR